MVLFVKTFYNFEITVFLYSFFIFLRYFVRSNVQDWSNAQADALSSKLSVFKFSGFGKLPWDNLKTLGNNTAIGMGNTAGNLAGNFAGKLKNVANNFNKDTLGEATFFDPQIAAKQAERQANKEAYESQDLDFSDSFDILFDEDPEIDYTDSLTSLFDEGQSSRTMSL